MALPVQSQLPRRVQKEFVALQDQLGSNFELYVNKADFEHDLTNGDFDISIFFEGQELLREKTYPQNIKIELYTKNEEQKDMLLIVNRTIKNKKAAKNIFLPVQVPRFDKSATLYLDVFDSHGVLNSSFKQDYVVNSAIAVEQTDVPNIICQEDDGDCLLEYMLRNVTFSANFDYNLKTQVYKNDKGQFFVNIPIKRGRRLGARVSGIKKSGSKNNNSPVSTEEGYPFFEGDEEAGFAFWNNIRDAIEFNFTGSNKFFIFDNDGAMQISSNNETGFLNIAGGDGTKAPIVIDQGSLMTNPAAGALEYDGQDLYFTNHSNSRIKLSQAGLQGPPGPPGPAGAAASGIDLSNGGFLNGNIQFLNTSMVEDAVFNGSLAYRTGAFNGHVLVSDANGSATWQSLASIANGISINGSVSSGVLGSIQFSDGVNGFASDSSNLVWDDVFKTLEIGSRGALFTSTVSDNTDLAHNAYYDSGTGNWRRRDAVNSATMLELQQPGSQNFAFYTASDANNTADSVITWEGIMGGRGSGVWVGSSLVTNSELSVITTDPTKKVLNLRAAGGQTANLQEWQNNGGVIEAYIDNQGKAFFQAQHSGQPSLTVNGASNWFSTEFIRGFTDDLASSNVYYFTSGNAHKLGRSVLMEGGIYVVNSINNNDQTMYRIGNSSTERFEILAVDNGVTIGETFGFNRIGEAQLSSNVNDVTPSLNFNTPIVGNDIKIGEISFNDNRAAISGYHGVSSAFGYLTFDTRHAAVTSEKMRLDSNGDLGIGFTDPQQKLSVNGSIQMLDGNQVDGYVMVSDINGVASWQNLNVVANGTGLGASGSAGRIQLSDGSGNFDSENEFFFDATNNGLVVNSTSPGNYALYVRQDDAGSGRGMLVISNPNPSNSIELNADNAEHSSVRINTNNTLRNAAIGFENSASANLWRLGTGQNAGQLHLGLGIANSGVMNTGNTIYSVHNGGNFLFGSKSSMDLTRKVEIMNSNASVAAFAVEGANGQTANLMELNDFNGTELLVVDNEGGLIFGSDTNLFRPSANVLRTDDNLISTSQVLSPHFKNVDSSRFMLSDVGGIDLRVGGTSGFGQYTDILITPSANVGIGTDNPGYKLDVNGNAQFAGTNHSLRIVDLGVSGNSIQSSNSGEHIRLLPTNRTHFFQEATFNAGQGATRDLIVYGQTNQDFLMADVGNERLGIGNAFPSYKLDVNGDVQFLGANYGLRFVDGGLNGHSIVSSSSGTHVRFRPSNRTDFFQEVNINQAQGSLGDFNVFGDVNGNFIHADVSDETIGIGVTSPTAKVHIDRPSSIGTWGGLDTTQAAVRIDDASTSMFIDGNAILSTNLFTFGTTTANEIHIGTNGTKVIEVEADGDVGFGLNNPSRNVHISEAMRIEPQSSPPASAALGDLYVDSDSNELCFYDGTVWTGLKSGGACI